MNKQDEMESNYCSLYIHFKAENSIRNKFHFLAYKIKGNVDIMMISETKLDNTFPTGQFLLDGFNEPIRLDRNKNGGSILLFIGEGIPTKVLSFETSPIKGFFIEIIFTKRNGFYVVLIIRIVTTLRTTFQH